MLVKIYALCWLLVAAAAGISYAVTGNFNETALTVFGFLFSTLFFMGVIAVLPWWVDRRYSYYSRQN